MPKRYEDATESDLLSHVKEGDFDAFTELSARYGWLIRLKAEAPKTALSPDMEDLIQEGYFGLFVAAKSFDDSMGASFQTYARICIQNRMIGAYRRYQSKKNMLLTTSASLDGRDMAGAADREDPAELLEIKENMEVMNRKIQGLLSPMERQVLSLYLSGVKRSDIEKRAGITVKAFDNAMHRVRSKLKNSRAQ